MVSEKKMINEIVNEDDDDEDDDEDGRHIIPIALGLSANGLKIQISIFFKSLNKLETYAYDEAVCQILTNSDG